MLSGLKSWIADRETAWRKSWRHDISSPWARFQAHLDAHIYDHAFLRIFWTNREEIGPGVWRSNQPSPRQLRALKRQGIRTIVNFRGENRLGSYALERDACARAGLTLIDYKLYSRGLPTVDDIQAVKRIFETAERPLLMHCKSGADRAGIGAALYVLLCKGGSIEEAQAQLSFRYLHLKKAKTGILDHFLETYRRFDAATPTPFLDWAEQHYDRDAVRAGFQASGFWEIVASDLLRRE